MIKVGILTSEIGWHIESLQKALTQRGILSHCFPITRLMARVSDKPRVTVEDQQLEDYQALLVRIIPGGSLEQIIFRMDVLHRLEDLGVMVMNAPAAIEKTVDKYYTSAILEDNKILTPKTIVAENFDDAMKAFRELGDVVVKPLFGSGGKGMVRICDEDIAYRTFRALELGGYVFYLQEYIPHDNYDIRAFVVGNQVVAAMIRRSNTWKTNIARGATAEPYVLEDQLVEMSLKACHLLQVDYAGVDILRSTGGQYYLIEVNSIPGWAGLQQTTPINIAEKIVEHLIDKYHTWRHGDMGIYR
ncbi:MAG TPA: RimK family alpha-L-glutamate ligase [Candidatus Limnocylindrales bacterium]|nr:RimK family alpha-L-glutamate ligase [Candidatus Limnocylindrales bacterium]